MDLIVPPGPGIPRGLVIPNDALLERFSRSSGPGGQGVNTADSRVELELSLATTPGLTDSQRRRVIAALGERIVVRRFVRWALGETTQKPAEEEEAA